MSQSRAPSPFARRVLRAVRRIPPGRVATCGDIAAYAGQPRAWRAVGRIMRDSRAPGVPYHRVVAAGDRQLEIRATKRLRRGVAADLDQVSVEIDERGDRVEVRTVYPRRSSGSASVEYEVRMPRDARVSIRSVSGDVTLTGVSGESRVETVSGDLAISAVPQLARAKTVSGDIQLRDTGTDGELSAESVSGDIIVEPR